MTRNRAKELLPILQAYAEGKEIQCYSDYYGKWISLEEYHFHDDTEYRIKPTEKGYRCRDCMHLPKSFAEEPCRTCEENSNWEDLPSWANADVNCKGCKYDTVPSDEEPCCDCTKNNNLYKAEENYRPFKSVEELIAHYDRTANNSRPANTMPLIWVRDKECKSVNLITAYNENCVFIQDVFFDLSELFDKYEFLDGTPCGVEVE